MNVIWTRRDDYVPPLRERVCENVTYGFSVGLRDAYHHRRPGRLRRRSHYTRPPPERLYATARRARPGPIFIRAVAGTRSAAASRVPRTTTTTTTRVQRSTRSTVRRGGSVGFASERKRSRSTSTRYGRLYCKDFFQVHVYVTYYKVTCWELCAHTP